MSGQNLLTGSAQSRSYCEEHWRHSMERVKGTSVVKRRWNNIVLRATFGTTNVIELNEK